MVKEMVTSVILLLTLLGVESSPKYTTRYDNIDLDAIFKSPRLQKNYLECVMERGPCTREGLEFRKNLPEIIQTECSKCSQVQKVLAKRIMSHLQQHNKGFWNEILLKFDPDGSFQKKYSFGGDDEEEDDDDI